MHRSPAAILCTAWLLATLAIAGCSRETTSKAADTTNSSPPAGWQRRSGFDVDESIAFGRSDPIAELKSVYSTANRAREHERLTRLLAEANFVLRVNDWTDATLVLPAPMAGQKTNVSSLDLVEQLIPPAKLCKRDLAIVGLPSTSTIGLSNKLDDEYAVSLHEQLQAKGFKRIVFISHYRLQLVELYKNGPPTPQDIARKREFLKKLAALSAARTNTLQGGFPNGAKLPWTNR